MFHKNKLLVSFIFILIIVCSCSFQLLAQKIDMHKLKGLKPRSIGPAGMSGRVTAFDVVLRNTDIIYAGTASGGLWRSTSAGVNWVPVFDDQPVLSIGAVAVDQRVPDIIWVGTGEANPRNSQSSGNGIYKSIDGGKTWEHPGLDKTRNISRVIVDPINSDVVYVAAIGSAWDSTDERGVYKTTDGGISWNKILYVDNKTGAADMIMDPVNPNKLFAAMWEYRRWPWYFKSGGPASGLYVTFDGGKNWTKRTDKDGLPEGDLGRIGMALCNKYPNVVYAIIESKKNALYRSDDGGFKWRMVNDKEVGDRPFYYSQLAVDPENENRLYDIHSIVTVSEDGGKTFGDLISWNRIHPDHHAFWISPEDPSFLIDGNDGGMAISHDKGKTWRFVENLPLAQFYHISYDMDMPYNIYGGMQDNGSWMGPSRVLNYSGITNVYWQMLSFGDGFNVLPDPANSRYGYSMSQGGNLVRYDILTGHTKFIRPPDPDTVKLRFNWNAGIAQDRFDDATIYYGSQFLHKSTDRGDSWEIISPDLTTNDSSKQKQYESGGLTYDVTDAENFTTIIAIDPSPVNKNVIWVGTDDGNLQVTKDAGKSWKNVSGSLKGVPERTWIPQVRASSYSESEAWVVLDNHRRNDWDLYAYYTRDFGEHWTRIADDDSIFGYALSILQDPVEPNLVFLGTEFGLYLSFDKARTWNKWKEGYPNVSTMDMQIHQRKNDLIVGTFGRSVYIFDNIEPLREIAGNNKILDESFHLFPVPESTDEIYRWKGPGPLYPGESDFKGDNRPAGAMITFYLNPDTSGRKGNKEGKNSLKFDKAKNDSVKIEIMDSDGKVVRTLNEKVEPGVNRIYWNYDRKGVRWPNTPKPEKELEYSGPSVLPGNYRIKVSFEDYTDSSGVEVKSDPRVDFSVDNLKAKSDYLDKILAKVETATEAADRIREAEKTIALIKDKVRDISSSQTDSLIKKSNVVKDSLKALMELINQPEVQGIRDNPNTLSARLSSVYEYVNSSFDAPGKTADNSLLLANEKLESTIIRINTFFATTWKDYETAVKEAGVSFFEEFKPLKY
jgi:photosystem II stability/assembly factor-like uncharacterized protein